MTRDRRYLHETLFNKGFSVGPGGTATGALLPSVAGQAGLSASLVHAPTATGAATLALGQVPPGQLCSPRDPCIPPNPIVPPEPVVPITGALGYTDLFAVVSVGADSMSARFCFPATPLVPPSSILPGDPCGPPSPIVPPSPIGVLYFTGSAWATTCGSGNAPVAVDATPNLDGSVSATRATATFDAASTPTISALTGTVFAAVLTDTTPPVTTASASPTRCQRLEQLQRRRYLVRD